METVIRMVIIYLAIVFGLRILGKREFGQLSPLELITLLLIPEITSQAIVLDDYSLTNALISLATILTLVFITSSLTHYFPRMETIIASRPSVLVEHGQYVTDTMNKERISPGEVTDAMHKAGLYRLDHVQWALLQSDGKIAIIAEPGYDINQQQVVKTQETVM